MTFWRSASSRVNVMAAPETDVSETATRTSVEVSCVSIPWRTSTLPEPASTVSEKVIVNEPSPSVSAAETTVGDSIATAIDPSLFVSDWVVTADSVMNSVGFDMPATSASASESSVLVWDAEALLPTVKSTCEFALYSASRDEAT